VKQTNGYGAVFRLSRGNRFARGPRHPAGGHRVGQLREDLVLSHGPDWFRKIDHAGGAGEITSMNDFPRHIVTTRSRFNLVHPKKTQHDHATEYPLLRGRFRSTEGGFAEDADIVLVGEDGDLETISLALTAAETGLVRFFGAVATRNNRRMVRAATVRQAGRRQAADAALIARVYWRQLL